MVTKTTETDHEHVWRFVSPALTFVMLSPDPLVECGICHHVRKATAKELAAARKGA